MNDIFKREPTLRKVPSTKHEPNLLDIALFKGIETFDNPLLANQNSAYSAKNVYRDDVGNLTVRPRLVPDLDTPIPTNTDTVKTFTHNNVLYYYDDTNLYAQTIVDGELTGEHIEGPKLKEHSDVVFQVYDNFVYFLLTNDNGKLTFYKYDDDFVEVGGNIELNVNDPVKVDKNAYNVLNNEIRVREPIELKQYPSVMTTSMFESEEFTWPPFEEPDIKSYMYGKVGSSVQLPTQYIDTEYFRTPKNRMLIVNKDITVWFIQNTDLDEDKSEIYVRYYNKLTNDYRLRKYSIDYAFKGLYRVNTSYEISGLNTVTLQYTGEHVLLYGADSKFSTMPSTLEMTLVKLHIPLDGSDLTDTSIQIKDVVDTTNAKDIVEVSAAYDGQFVARYDSLYNQFNKLLLFEFESVTSTQLNETASYDGLAATSILAVSHQSVFTASTSGTGSNLHVYQSSIAKFSGTGISSIGGSVSVGTNPMFCSSYDALAYIAFDNDELLTKFKIATSSVSDVDTQRLPISRFDYISLQYNDGFSLGVLGYTDARPVYRQYKFTLSGDKYYMYDTDLTFDTQIPHISDVTMNGERISAMSLQPHPSEDSIVVYLYDYTRKLGYNEQILNRPTENGIPVLPQIEDEAVTSFYLDNTYWFITEHNVFGTGSTGDGTNTIEYWTPRKYFSITETITAAIRLSDTSFWLMHNNGAYLIYKSEEHYIDEHEATFAKWNITSTAKSRGCDFKNAVTVLPIHNYVAVVTDHDISVLQMQQFIQSDERSLVPITNNIAKLIAELLTDSELKYKDVVIGTYKYLTLFFFNIGTTHTPCLVLDNSANIWWLWEFPVSKVLQVNTLENTVSLLVKDNDTIKLYTLDEDLFEHAVSSRMAYEIYCDSKIIDNNKELVPIEWHWESAVQTFKSTDYKKKLLHTGFVLTDYNERRKLQDKYTLLETDMSFDYTLQVYDRTYSEQPTPAIHRSVSRIANALHKTVLGRFMYLQVRLNNRDEDINEMFQHLTKPKITSIGFKYMYIQGV